MDPFLLSPCVVVWNLQTLPKYFLMVEGRVEPLLWQVPPPHMAGRVAGISRFLVLDHRDWPTDQLPSAGLV